MEKQKIKIHLQFDKQSRKWVDKTNTYWTLQGDSRNIKRFHLSQVVYISHIVKWFVFIWIVLYIYLKFKLKRKGKRTICSQIYYHTVHTSHNILHLFQYKSFNYELHYLFVEKCINDKRYAPRALMVKDNWYFEKSCWLNLSMNFNALLGPSLHAWRQFPSLKFSWIHIYRFLPNYIRLF